MARLPVKKIRSLLSDLILTFEEGATNPEIVAKFRTAHPAAIREASRDLEDIALAKLITDAGKKISSSPPTEPDLFSDYSVPTVIIISAPEKGRKLHKPTAKSTKNEIQRWIDGHSKLKPVTTTQVIEMRRMIDEIGHLMADNTTTVEDALFLFKAEKETKKE